MQSLSLVLLLCFVIIFGLLWFSQQGRWPFLRITDCPSCLVVQPSVTLPATTGTRRALLVGINYYNTDNELYGCIEDVENVSAALKETLDYDAANITVLTDDEPLMANRPTHANIRAALTALIAATQAGDVAFVWYSGHGTQIRNFSAPSGFSNAWYPLDGSSAGLLLETDLQDIVSDAPAGAKVFVGSDCCHSGTLLDLKFMVGEIAMVRKVKTMVPPSAQLLEGGANGLPIPKSLHRLRPINEDAVQRPAAVDAVTGGAAGSRSPSHTYVLVSDANFTATDADVVCLSGCRDTETSADTVLDNQPQGAMTWSFLKTLRTFGKEVALTNMLSSMRLLLASNLYSQIPQLSMGRAVNPSEVTLEQLL